MAKGGTLLRRYEIGKHLVLAPNMPASTPPRILLFAGPPNGQPVFEGLLPAHQAGLLTLAGVVTDEKLASRGARRLVDRAQRLLLRRAAEAAGVPVVTSSALRQPRIALALQNDWRAGLAVVLDSCSCEVPQRVQGLLHLGVVHVRTLFRRQGDRSAMHIVRWNHPSRQWKNDWMPAAMLRMAEAQHPSVASGFHVARQQVVAGGEEIEGIVTWKDARVSQRLANDGSEPLKLFFKYGRPEMVQALCGGTSDVLRLEVLGGQPPPSASKAERLKWRAHQRSLRLEIDVQRELAAATAELIVRGVKSLLAESQSLEELR